MANLLENPSERDVTRCLTIHFTLGCCDNKSERQQLHKKKKNTKEPIFRQEFYFLLSYIYLRVSLWEELYDVKQAEDLKTLKILSSFLLSYQAGI